MSDELDKLVEEAKTLGIKSPHLYKDEEKLQEKIDEKKEELQKDRNESEAKEVAKEIVPEEVTEPVATEEPAKKEKAGSSDESDKAVCFYWKNGQNITFTAGEIIQNGKVIVAGKLYKTKNSVLRLNPIEDAEAVKHLKAHKNNEANGGLLFTSLKPEDIKESDSGKLLDRLMKMDDKSLAELNGGGVVNMRKSKGTLIAEILAKKNA